jgi:hypothetical protein
VVAPLRKRSAAKTPRLAAATSEQRAHLREQERRHADGGGGRAGARHIAGRPRRKAIARPSVTVTIADAAAPPGISLRPGGRMISRPSAPW